MTRTRFRGTAAGFVLLLIAGLGWLFLVPRGTPVPPQRPGETSRKPASESGEEAEARSAASTDPVPGDSNPAVRRTGPEGSTRPEVEGKRVTGCCVLEDGTPLAGAGVSVSEEDPSMGHEDDPVLGAWEGTRTGADGTFEFAPGSRIRAEHPFARAVAAEGGTAVIEDRGVFVRTGAETGTLRILFRDDPGTAHVQLVDSSDRTPVITVKGLRLTYLFGRDLSGRGVFEYPKDLGLGGWIPIREGAIPQELGVEADPAGVVVEFAARGFAPKRVPLPEIRGRMQVAVDPIPFCVAGDVLLHPRGLPAPMGPEARVTAELRRAEGDSGPPPAEARGLPNELGSFRIDGLPQGAWVLEVAASLGGSLVRSRRTFEYRGSPVDLGDILLQQGAAVRARAVDSAGESIPQARVVVVREGEDQEKARVLPPGGDGWVAYADLEPNAAHRVVALGMPGPLEKPARTSADGSPVEVELAWPEKLVPCRITLVVDGKAVANADGSRTIPATVHESPLPRDQGAWHADGTFAAKLLPGTYRFSAYATPEGGGDLALFGAEVTVPSGESFETRLELIRESR